MVKFRKSLDSLAGKLILTIGLLMTIGSMAFGFVFFKYEESVTMRNLSSHARFSADLVEQGIHAGMLSARRDAVRDTVRAMGKVEDVREIKLFNSAGVGVYASRDQGVGSRIEDEGPFAHKALDGEHPEPRISTTPSGKKVLKLFTPIENELTCYTAACHVHSKKDRVLGVLLTSFSASSIEVASRQMLIGTLFFGGVFVASISVSICIILYKFVSKPVALLEQGMKRLSKGDFDRPIRLNTKDEMGLLAETFNSMALDLKHYREKMENWTHSLQQEVEKKTAEIMEAQEQLVNAEKLASLGRLAAGVAHELNNPLTGVVTFAHLMRERTPPERKQDVDDLEVIIEQANRCSKIIKGLLGFSRKGASEKMRVNLNDLVESSVSIVQNQSNFHNVKIETGITSDIPPVTVDPNQIQQVIINLLSNAADAMNETGQITITTSSVHEDGREYVEMSFTDTGPGIIPEHMGKIFEPFFTTKPVGQGTGLGLPVSYGIIKKHSGEILVRSKVGKGTTFVVRLPAAGKDHAEETFMPGLKTEKGGEA